MIFSLENFIVNILMILNILLYYFLWLPSITLKMLVTQLCLTLYNPMHCTPSDSSVHGILQTKILE